MPSGVSHGSALPAGCAGATGSNVTLAKFGILVTKVVLQFGNLVLAISEQIASIWIRRCEQCGGKGPDIVRLTEYAHPARQDEHQDAADHNGPDKASCRYVFG